MASKGKEIRFLRDQLVPLAEERLLLVSHVQINA